MFETKEGLIEQIVYQHGKAMVNFAYTYLKDWSASEDVVQDALIKIYRHINSFNQQSSLKTWVFRIVANQSKDYLRRNFVKRWVTGGIAEPRLVSKRICLHNELKRNRQKGNWPKRYWRFPSNIVK